jgi:hypothetical protein
VTNNKQNSVSRLLVENLDIRIGSFYRRFDNSNLQCHYPLRRIVSIVELFRTTPIRPKQAPGILLFFFKQAMLKRLLDELEPPPPEPKSLPPPISSALPATHRKGGSL